MGLSQEELAQLTGVSRQSVTKWETGQSAPDLDRLVELADVLGVSLDFLLRGPQRVSSLLVTFFFFLFFFFFFFFFFFHCCGFPAPC